MAYYRDYQLQKAVRGFINISEWRNPFAVTLTMRNSLLSQTDSELHYVALDASKARQNLKHFLNTLNRKVLGSAYSRFRRRLRVIPILEGGDGTHLHWHLAIDCPSDEIAELFPQMVESLWCATHWGAPQADIKRCDEGWVDYITKRRTKPDFGDSIDWELFEP